MVENNFDYGTEAVVEAGATFKNPEVGEHTAVLRSIIHCGLFREEFKGELKKPAPEVVAIFELKDEEDFEEDGITPLTLHKSFPLKKGDRAFMTKFLKALDPKGQATGFNDLIGKPCQITAKGSKTLNDDGTPKYVNFGGIAGLPAKFAKMVEPLTVKGVGHVPFKDLTEEAILELHPIIDVALTLMKGEEYKGSKAEAIVNAIRKENPEFAVYQAEGKTEGETERETEVKEVKTNLKEEEEF